MEIFNKRYPSFERIQLTFQQKIIPYAKHSFLIKHIRK